MSEIELSIAPGPLGVGIYRNEVDGSCVVSKKTNAASPIKVGDVIVRLNGVNLSTIKGGVPEWVSLFQLYSKGVRNVVVRRSVPSSGVTATAATVPAAVPATSTGAPTNNNAKAMPPASLAAPSAPKATTAQKAVGGASVREQPSKSNKNVSTGVANRCRYTVKALRIGAKWGIGLVGAAGSVRIASIDKKGGSFAKTDLKVGMTIDTINGVHPTDAAHGIRLLTADSRVAIVVAFGPPKKKEALKPSTHQNAQKRKVAESKTKTSNKKQAVSKKQAVPKKQAAPKKQAVYKTTATTVANEFNHDDEYMYLLENGFPDPGCVSACQNYYVTKNNDTYKTIATKLGMEDWKQLSSMPFNVRFYGRKTRTNQVIFAPRTIIKIPKTAASQWKMNKMVDNHHVEIQAMATCSKCLRKEIPNDPDEMLICDGCDVEMHVSCAGLAMVPTCDWLCPTCLEVLDARKKHLAEGAETRSLEAKLRTLPPLDAKTIDLAAHAKQRFIADITIRKERALEQLEENQRVLEVESAKQIDKLKRDLAAAEIDETLRTNEYNNVCLQCMDRLKLVGWEIGFGESYIEYETAGGWTEKLRRRMVWNRGESFVYLQGTQREWEIWHDRIRQYGREVRSSQESRQKDAAIERVKTLKEELESAEADEKSRPVMNKLDFERLMKSFATLLSEPRLEFETNREFISRVELEPLFLGAVRPQDSSDVQVLNVLKEPTELVINVPVDQSVGDSEGALRIGVDYYLWGSAELFSSDRNDCLPMDFSPTSVRSAQRDLITMLLRDHRNSSLQVSAPSVPSSVCLRGSGADETLSQMTKCFDLSELVRDCNYPIENQPFLDTPKRLADNGLELRNYQKTSLKWLVEKETNPTGMGSSGELWHRMRGLGGNKNQGFFFCDLTGSILKDIFDYRSDVDQKDAAKLCGGDSFPSGAILGSEMGLGKTVIALSLVVASPPLLHNRTLPREHLAKINHPAYVPPPSVTECLGTPGNGYLSSGTMVIAPMTLCPQWQAEIERFAPWMSFITLHNDEKVTANEIASKDIVVISTFLLSSSGRGSKNGSSQLFSKLRRIHFHRIILDESHYNNTGDRVKTALSQLSSTHRYALTGTPVGHSLADLYGQLRFLRVPQFCRSDFWNQCIDTPYANHNCYALNVLRSLLSRVVIRHSKEQNLGGKSLVSLPPRTVETLLLEFGSKEEQAVYSYLEGINTARFMSLRSESPSTVLGKFIDLNGMLFASRHACGHVSLVNLDNVHNTNAKIVRERERKQQELERKLQKSGKGQKKAVPKNENLTRADILQQAITKARPSASTRMRESILSIHEGEIEYLECPICLEPVEEKEIALTPCAHKFCAECIKSCLTTLSSNREARGNCPECRDAITLSELTFLGDAIDIDDKLTANDDDQKPKAVEKVEAIDINGFNLLTKDIFSNAPGASDRRISAISLNSSEKRQQRAFCNTIPGEVLEAWNVASVQVGSKVARLLEEIKCMSENDATSKCVVFSQFLGSLDIVQQELTARSVKCTRVDGHMKQYERADNIHSFTNNPDVKVLLLSMRAGAAGLNLMAANYCFLLDPATNSAIEEQAIDRIHRIGQVRPVIVKRFIMKDTVEQRVLENRRSLAADRPTNAGLLDGSGDLMEDEGKNHLFQEKERHDDENGMGEKSFQRLKQLEALFGCEATLKVTKA